MAARTVETPADTVDIMPTLAAMIGLPVASGSVDGILPMSGAVLRELS